MDAGGSAPRQLLQGRYRLGEIVGQGGMAWVYRARDESLDRDVAVKVFQTSPGKGAHAGRQVEEVKVLARLNHHGLLTLLDAGIATDQDDQPHIFFVMEFVRGPDLGQRLREGRLSSQKTAYLGFDVAEALEYIHSRGVIHRDVKPANILLVEYSENEARPRTKLADFGVAKIAGSANVSVEGSTLGTAAYLSPEQARGEDITPAADVYSLGLVLLECLTGALAFPGDLAQSAVARLLRDPEIPQDLGEEWTRLLRAMTAREHEQRPTLREVILELRQIIVADMGRHRAPVSGAAADDAARSAALRRYDAVSGSGDPVLSRVVELARTVFDAESVVLVASAGAAERELVRAGDPGPASGTGNGRVEIAPLRTHDGIVIGAIRITGAAQGIGDRERAVLEQLAGLAMDALELRRVAARAVEAQTGSSVPVRTAPITTLRDARPDPAAPDG